MLSIIKKASCLIATAVISLSLSQVAFAGSMETTLHYSEQYGTYSDISESAELIMIATVKDVSVANIGTSSLLFTHYSVDVNEVIKNTKNYDVSDACVRFTGGRRGDVNYKVKETPKLTIGDTYLFVLNKIYPEDDTSNDFSPRGGYQGAFKVAVPEAQTFDLDGLDNYKIEPLNKHNKALENEISGETISELKAGLAAE